MINFKLDPSKVFIAEYSKKYGCGHVCSMEFYSKLSDLYKEDYKPVYAGITREACVNFLVNYEGLHGKD
jgi:hypothetical protein